MGTRCKLVAVPASMLAGLLAATYTHNCYHLFHSRKFRCTFHRAESAFRGHNIIGKIGKMNVAKPSRDNSPALREIPTWPRFSEQELKAAAEVLNSGNVNYWTGNQVRLFEKEYAKYCHRQHAVAVANGTLALESALLSLKLQPTDEVITPARGFVACASSILRAGAIPVFADVDIDSQSLSVETVRAALTPNTRVILVIHLGGCPANMDELTALAKQHNLRLIEDCSQAHGARWNQQPVGSFGDISVFSFCQEKIITTGGEGGMMLTNDEAVFNYACALRDHGRDYQKTPRHIDTEFQYTCRVVGSNFRMTELQAAIGRLQLKQLGRWVELRRANADAISRNLQDLSSVVIPQVGGRAFHAYYRYYFFLNGDKSDTPQLRAKLIQNLAADGIPAQVGSCPEIYKEPLFQELKLGPIHPLKVASELGTRSIALPVHPSIDVDTADFIGQRVRLHVLSL